MLSQFIPPLPATPNPLPAVLFAENPLHFNLVFLAGFGRDGRVDPLVVAQTFQFFVISNFWWVQTQVTYQPATSIFSPSDVVTLTGRCRAPHCSPLGHIAIRPAVPFNVVLNAGSVVALPADFGVPAEALPGKRFGMPISLPAAVPDWTPAAQFMISDRVEDVILGLLGGQIADPNNPFVGNELELSGWGRRGAAHAGTCHPIALGHRVQLGSGYLERSPRRPFGPPL